MASLAQKLQRVGQLKLTQSQEALYSLNNQLQQKQNDLNRSILAHREEKEAALLLRQQREEQTKKAEEQRREAQRQRLAQEEAKRNKEALLQAQKEKAEQERLAQQAALTQQEKIEELQAMDTTEDEQPADESADFLASLRREEQAQGIKAKSFWDNLTFKDPQKWLTGSLGYATTLRNLETLNSGREALKVGLNLNPISYFFASTTMSFDLNSYENIYYQPDFSYSFGYSDWHPNTFSLVYSNYMDNKFFPEEGKSRFNFQSGTWDLGYHNKFDAISFNANFKYVPQKRSKRLYLKAGTTLADTVVTSLQVKHYVDEEQNRIRLSAKTFLSDNLFISGSAYTYTDSDKQKPLDPDYAYSIGWKSKKPFAPSITYSNYYMPTRWGWKEEEGPHFKDGVLSVNFSLKF